MIVVVGDASWDVHYEVPRLPSLGETLSGRLIYQGPAGGSANTAAWSASLGSEVMLAAQLATDVAGGRFQIACDAIAQLHLHVLPGATHTRLTTVLMTPDTERTIVIDAPWKSNNVAPDEAVLTQLREAAVALINVDDRDTRTLYNTESNAITVLPMQFLADELESNSSWDVIVGSTAENEPPDSHDLLRVGAKLCVLTTGEAGGRFWLYGHWATYESLPVAARRDSTGAGDAFVGGLMVGLERGLAAEGALAVASWTGARAVEQMGSWPQSDLAPPQYLLSPSSCVGND